MNNIGTPSEYKWTWDYTGIGHCGRVWRLSDRATGRILGFVKDSAVGEAMAYDARVLVIDGAEISVGEFNHWTKAKRAVQSAVVGIKLHAAARGACPGCGAPSETGCACG